MEQYHETILVVEDDVQIRNFICYALKAEGFTCLTAGNAAAAMKLLVMEQADMMLLDLGLPDMDGEAVLKKVREWSEMPVIIVSARDQDKEKAAMLDLGADDYLTKPFSATELMARIRCICRRPQRLTDQHMTWHDLSFDPEQSMLSCGDRRCSLSRREGALLSLFLTHPEQTLPRETILLRIWGEESDVESGNLDNYIHFLRRRLKTVGSQAQLVTARGVGYRLTDI